MIQIFNKLMDKKRRPAILQSAFIRGIYRII